MPDENIDKTNENINPFIDKELASLQIKAQEIVNEIANAYAQLRLDDVEKYKQELTNITNRMKLLKLSGPLFDIARTVSNDIDRDNRISKDIENLKKEQIEVRLELNELVPKLNEFIKKLEETGYGKEEVIELLEENDIKNARGTIEFVLSAEGRRAVRRGGREALKELGARTYNIDKSVPLTLEEARETCMKQCVIDAYPLDTDKKGKPVPLNESGRIFRSGAGMAEFYGLDYKGDSAPRVIKRELNIEPVPFTEDNYLEISECLKDNDCRIMLGKDILAGRAMEMTTKKPYYLSATKILDIINNWMRGNAEQEPIRND